MYGRGQRPAAGLGPPMTPPVIQYLIIANLAVFIGQFTVPGLSDYCSVRPYLVWQQGYLWQPFTYMW
ncbi:MAG: hypothetical protein ACE5FL_15890, partial [Myxococcota bacterium]